MPRFSIVVPAYNAAESLGETLDAILAQAFDDWECVVVDDGSSDGTATLALDYARRDSRFKVLTQPNQGTGGAYNKGVSSATGDFVVLCSADDILLPGHLSSMSDFIDREEGYDIYSSNGYYWRPGDLREPVYKPGQRDGVYSLALTDVLRCCFYSVGAVYRRELFQVVGGYRLDVFGEDYDFWLRAMASGARHRYFPELLSLHRLSPTQKSASLEKAYQSDIRIVTEFQRDFALSAEECAAVDDCVMERERLTAQLHEVPSYRWRRSRAIARRLAVGILGEPNARRVLHSLKSRMGHRP